MWASSLFVTNLYSTGFITAFVFIDITFYGIQLWHPVIRLCLYPAGASKECLGAGKSAKEFD